MVCGTQSAFVNCFSASKCVYSTNGMASRVSGWSEMLVSLTSSTKTSEPVGTNKVISARTPAISETKRL